MEVDQLEEILGKDIKPDVSFLSELNNNIEKKSDVTQEKKQEIVSEGKYHCKYEDGFSTDKLTELMSHYRSQHPEHKGVNRIKKENREGNINEDNPEVITEMPEEDTDINTSIEMVSPVEVEEAKKKKDTKKRDITSVPTLYDRLETLLKGYQVRGIQGIIQSANMYDIGSISFIPVLKDLLRNTSTAPGLIGNISDAWSQIVGIKTETDTTKPTYSSVTGQNSSNEVDGVLRQMELDEARSLAMGSRRSMIEERELNNEMKRKRLSGELMETKNNPDINKTIELEMLKYQMMQPKNDSQTEILKQQIDTISRKHEEDVRLSQLREEYRKEREILISSMSEKDKKLDELLKSLQTPKTDSQVELLKQQLETQNKRYEDIQRKMEEDSKLNQLREEARKDREVLEKRLEQQAKETQELIKSIQVANTPKPEEIFKSQIVEVQKQSDLKMQEVLNQLKIATETRKEEEYRKTVDMLTNKIKEVEDKSLGAVGQVGESMKSFATEITHAFEKTMLEKEHERKEEELKKKISDIEHNRSMTNEQYAFEQTKNMLKDLGAGIKETIDSTLGKAEVPARKAAESAAALDKVRLSLELKNQGFSPDQITKIIGENQNRQIIPPGSSAQEWQNMQRAVDKPIIQQDQQIIQDIPQQEPTEQIKFATSENEK